MLQSAFSMAAARLGEDLEGSPLVRSRMLLAAADLARWILRGGVLRGGVLRGGGWSG